MDKLTSLLHPSPIPSLPPGPLRPQGTVPITHTLRPLHTHTPLNSHWQIHTLSLQQHTLTGTPTSTCSHPTYWYLPWTSLPLSLALSLSVSPRLTTTHWQNLSVCCQHALTGTLLTCARSQSYTLARTEWSISVSVCFSLCLFVSLSHCLSLSHTHTDTHTAPMPAAHPRTHLAAAQWNSHRPRSCVCSTCPPRPAPAPGAPSGCSSTWRTAAPARSPPGTRPSRCRSARSLLRYRSICPGTAPAPSRWRNDTRP